MNTMKHNESLTGELAHARWAGGTAQFTRVSEDESPIAPTAAWTKIIDFLLKWLKDPRSAIDDDYEAPRLAAIQGALELARRWRAASTVSPTRMGPTGDGGIAFEWRRDPEFHDVEVQGDGSAEYRVFIDCKLVRSMRLG